MTRRTPQWALKARTGNALSAKHGITQSKYDVNVVDTTYIQHTRKEERERERKREMYRLPV